MPPRAVSEKVARKRLQTLETRRKAAHAAMMKSIDRGNAMKDYMKAKATKRKAKTAYEAKIKLIEKAIKDVNAGYNVWIQKEEKKKKKLLTRLS